MSALATVFVWLLLLGLLGVEYLAAHDPPGSAAAPFIGLVMALIVSLTFMRLTSAPPVAKVFAMAGVFWLCVMMVLGSLDSATRHDAGVSMRTEH